jgi:hypothetical protein
MILMCLQMKDGTFSQIRKHGMQEKKKSNSMLDHKNVTLGYTCGKDKQ